MNPRKQSPAFSLAVAGMTAGGYVVLCLVFSAISFGAVQCRVAEVLTILPVFFPAAVPGLAIGCLVANMIGGLGIWDMVFGTFATLLAAVLTRLLRRVRVGGLPVLSTLPPVILNAVTVGAQLAAAGGNGFSMPLFWLTAAGVALGQLLSCTAGGLLLAFAIQKRYDIIEGETPFK